MMLKGFVRALLFLSLFPTFSSHSTTPPSPSILQKKPNHTVQHQIVKLITLHSTARKLDRGMNHKLVEKNSNRVLARYIRDPGVGDLAGVVEIFEGVEIKGWDV